MKWRKREIMDEIHSCSPFCDRPLCVAVRDAVQAEREAWQEPVAEMVLIPYEPCIEMQEQGSVASNYDLSQTRAKRVYQSMINAYLVRSQTKEQK